MLPNKVKEAAASIGQFYLKKNNQDYQKTETEILNLHISKIEVNEDNVTITTARPGLLIGSKGTNIGNLEKYLNTKIKILEEKDPLNSYLIPYDDSIDYYYNDSIDYYYNDIIDDYYYNNSDFERDAYWYGQMLSENEQDYLSKSFDELYKLDQEEGV